MAESVDCDLAFAALPALVVAGAAVGNALTVRVKRGYEQPPLLWLLTVGDSGTGKSPGQKPAADLAFRINRLLKDDYLVAVQKYEAELAAWEELATPDPALKPVKPVRQRFAVTDISIERLALESVSSPRRQVMIFDEAATWFGSFTRYKGKAGGTDRGNWLSVHDAGAVVNLRKTGDQKDIDANRVFAAIFGGIQPGVLTRLFADDTFTESGLGARLGYAYPPKRCPKWSDAELSSDTEQRFAGVLDFLRKLLFDAKSGPGWVGLEMVALDRFIRLNNEFAETAEGIDGGPMAAVLPKAVRFALRLALVWHCVSKAAAGRDPSRATVTDEAMRAGETLARWFVGEAERVNAMLAESPEDRRVRQLAEWVKRKGGQVSPRDLMRCNRKYRTAQAAEAALDTLVCAGYGSWAEPACGTTGRLFELHPRADTTADTQPVSEETDDSSAFVGRRPEGNDTHLTQPDEWRSKRPFTQSGRYTRRERAAGGEGGTA